MTALYAAMLGMQATAPLKAVKLAERAQFIRDHHWTYAEYDAAHAGDILFQREYEKMVAAAERKALEDAKAQADGE